MSHFRMLEPIMKTGRRQVCGSYTTSYENFPKLGENFPVSGFSATAKEIEQTRTKKSRIERNELCIRNHLIFLPRTSSNLADLKTR